MLAAALAVGALLGAVQASAQTSSLPLVLSWKASEECPTADQIRADLARIARPRSGRQLAALTARALITRDVSGYHLLLETEREGTLNQAHVDSPTCAPLGRVATLMLALAYGDGAQVVANDEPAPDDGSPYGTLPGSPSAAPSKPKPSLPVPPVAPRGVASQRHPHAQLQLEPWLAAILSTGFVAPLALGAEVGAQTGSRRWLASLRIRDTPQTEAARRDQVSVRLSSASVALGGCARVPIGQLSVAGCATFSAGALRASSRGALRDGGANPAWFALTPSFLAEFRGASRWSVRLELGAQVPFSRPELVVEGEGVVYRASGVAPELGVGVGLIF